jgi:predicted ATPase
MSKKDKNEKITINPNSTREKINKCDINDIKNFPYFLRKIKFFPFRHIDSLEVEFKHPVSVITGTNKTGKSTILMAIACSHVDFKKRNHQNGKLERQTWSSLVKFTNFDTQKRDWKYLISYKQGNNEIEKLGERKVSTKKWSGIGKRESQFDFRDVVYLDLDRLTPARVFNSTLFTKAKKPSSEDISLAQDIKQIQQYCSYVLEDNVSINKIAEHQDKDILSYSGSNKYSSYNSAAGEEAVSKIIIEIVKAKPKSLILIDEVEVGLHPKVQRRLLDVIYHLSHDHNKQFIITTHSHTVLSYVPPVARIFIYKDGHSEFRNIPQISINAALSFMDSANYPLLDVFCEDKIATRIISLAIREIDNERKYFDFYNLINIIFIGSAQCTFDTFLAHQKTHKFKKIRSGYCCILDSDIKTKEKNIKIDGYISDIHLLLGETTNHHLAPEQILVGSYLKKFPNDEMSYHLESSNAHFLFKAMLEKRLANSEEEAFDNCWKVFVETEEGKKSFEALKKFLINQYEKWATSSMFDSIY